MSPIRLTLGLVVWLVLAAIAAFLSVWIQPAAAQVALWLLLSLMVLGSFTAYSSIPENARANDDDNAPRYRFPHGGTLGVGIWLLMLAVSAGFALVSLMVPSAEATFFRCEVSAGHSSSTCAEAVRLGIAVFGGLVGSTIYCIERFVEFSIKKREFRRQYIAWYVARPAQAGLLALTFYLLIRGGVLAIQAQSPDGSAGSWGLASVCIMVGMFANDAMQRLRETFRTLFGNDQTKAPDPQGKDPGDA